MESFHTAGAKLEDRPTHVACVPMFKSKAEGRHCVRCFCDETFCDLDIVAGSYTVRCHALVIASALPRLGKILLDLDRPSEDVITVILSEVRVQCVK